MAKKPSSNGNDTITCHLAVERKTTNTIRYQAVTPEGQVIEDEDVPVKTLYLSKSAFENMPDKLVLTISRGE